LANSARAIEVPDTTVQSRPVGRFVEFCVYDTGVGIPPEQLDLVFDRFHRVDMSLMREATGMGLGLTLCKRIVELHDGAIWAESRPGEGSAFHVLLPVAAEAALLVPLAWNRPRRRLEQSGHRRMVAIGLLAIVSLANAVLLLAVIASLVRGDEKSGAQLLLKAITVWMTNTITFGLWYWAFDRGGPVRRLEPDPPPPDFQFPQLENPQLAAPGWQPELVDYLYVSLTNSIAFSPTDAMPLSRWAKLLMSAESALSSITVLLVAARAVNIFK